MRFSLFRRDTKWLGAKGERLAAKYLRRQGYRLLERNFRSPGGEIDIIAQDGDGLVFVEVKTRRGRREEFIKASVNRNKMRRLVRTSLYYLKGAKINYQTARYDVVFIKTADRPPAVEHIKNAFSLNDVPGF